ncbi:MAG: PEP-CTERM sorting domain-containing protein [Planctomycetota bacterium]|nr:PEP-CTERM sorting domain-containing protein [Planctomycetota bacterium]
MLRHLQTGQAVCTLRAAALTLLSLTFISGGLLAQAKAQGTAANLSSSVRAASYEAPKTRTNGNSAIAAAPASDATSPKGAANPAPEPNTLMLLGTGAVVLLLLYTRRRVRAVATSTTQA